MFSSSLVNPPSHDPGLLVTLQNQPSAYLLDCGDLSRIRHRDLARVIRLFVTHTHIDHFIGFDHLVRMQLFCEHTLEVYGPAGILEHVRGKLAGYAWNLVDESRFSIRVHELGSGELRSTLLPCRDRFAAGETCVGVASRTLELPEGAALSWCAVEHNVPCLAYRLQAPPVWKVDKQALAASGLAPGPWLTQLKDAMAQGRPDVELEAGRAEQLAERLLQHEPGRSLAYVTDTVYNKKTVPAITQLARGVDELWCEASYLHAELDKAREYLHMTARQAARLARDAEVGRLYLMHLSRRYSEAEAHLQEARQVFADTLPSPVYSS